MLTITAVLGFADDSITQPSSTLPIEKAVEKQPVNKSFGYARMSIADSDAIRAFQTLPGLGLGYRYNIDAAAIDVSANYTREVAGKENETYFYTAPRVSYLRYWNGEKDQSFYYGAGLAWGGVRKSADENFAGLVPNATVGYEMNRNATVRSFVQLDVSQPALSITTTSVSYQNLPGPLAEVSIGLGF